MLGVCRIFAGVSGSPGSVHALRQAAALARHHAVPLNPLLAWLPPGGSANERKDPCPEVRQLWEDQAWQRLWKALDTAFGGLPTGIATQPVVVRGKPGRALTLLARQPGDLVVIGAGRRGPPAAAGRMRCRPLLPGPRLLSGAGRPAVGAGAGSGLWPARLGGPAPLDPGRSTAGLACYTTACGGVSTECAAPPAGACGRRRRRHRWRDGRCCMWSPLVPRPRGNCPC